MVLRFCMQDVILKRGNTRQAHFTHKFFACEGPPESPVPKWAKELIATCAEKRIRLRSGDWFFYPGVY